LYLKSIAAILLSFYSIPAPFRVIFAIYHCHVSNKNFEREGQLRVMYLFLPDPLGIVSRITNTSPFSTMHFTQTTFELDKTITKEGPCFFASSGAR
jgi:hypothetical protein